MLCGKAMVMDLNLPLIKNTFSQKNFINVFFFVTTNTKFDLFSFDRKLFLNFRIA